MPPSEQIQQLKPLLRRLWLHIGTARRAQFGGVFALMIAASFAEVLSLGAVVPFLGVLTSPEMVLRHPAAQWFIHALHIETAADLLLPLTLAFGAAALINGAMRLILLWSTTRLSVLAGADLSVDMYKRTLYQPYSVHIARNSSEIINAISVKTGTTIHVLLMILNLLSSMIILAAILGTLFAINPRIALFAILGFSVIYALVVRLTRRSLLDNSERVARETTLVIKSLQEGLGGIRDVLLDGSQALYCEIYHRSDFRARKAQGNSAFLNGSPRYAVEALAMLLIAALAYFLARQPGGVLTAIPVLGTLALGAQRLLPVMQQAYSSWASIKSSQASLSDALDLLEQPLPAWADGPRPLPLPFERNIRLRNVSFRYAQDSHWIIENADLTIAKGARIGIVGGTGSGKSTVTDIVMGLLTRYHGELLIDGQPVDDSNRRSWQAHIAHVPQSIFLTDASISENIAFGVPHSQIDHSRVRRAAQLARIDMTIESLPEQYGTIVGERGMRLSGGQRQRIGIARALYKRADVIILDEATSALDSETESSVMQAIESLEHDLTVLIIAHRISTLRGCDAVYEVRNGKISLRGSGEAYCSEFGSESVRPS